VAGLFFACAGAARAAAAVRADRPCGPEARREHSRPAWQTGM